MFSNTLPYSSKSIRVRVLMAALAFYICMSAGPAVQAQSKAFTYQGRLTNASVPANGTFKSRFALFDRPTGGTEIAFQASELTVINGIFTVTLDFGADAFDGNDRYLEIMVDGNRLTPRQPITYAPYAIRSSRAALADAASSVNFSTAALAGVVPIVNGGTGSSTKDFVDLSTNQTIGGRKTFTQPLLGDGSQLTNLNGANITTNTISASALAADTFPNLHNLSLLGSLRWDLLRQRVPVSADPRGVAFDGANIWVVSAGGVSKIRASDGANLGTFGVGGNPAAIAFDGANVWVANVNDGSVTKLRTSDGANLGTFGVGLFPLGVAFDGANIWVSSQDANNVTKLRASDGATLATYPAGAGARGVAFDGTNIWIANPTANTVTKLRASDGLNLGTFPAANNPCAFAFDGANMWVAGCAVLGGVTVLRASTGANIGSYAVGGHPNSLAFDGDNIWAVNNPENTIVKVRARDGVNLSTVGGDGLPYGIAFDGTSMWVSNRTGNSLIKLPALGSCE